MNRYKKTDMKKGIIQLLIAVFIMGFTVTACENDDITVNNGVFPETEGVNSSIGMLRSLNFAKETPHIDMDFQNKSDVLYIELTQPAIQAETYTVKVDEAQVAVYNAKNEVNYLLFPAEQVTLENKGTLTVEQGKQKSNTVTVSFTYNKSLSSGVYLLPLTIDIKSESTIIAEKYHTLYYLIDVWAETLAEHKVTEKDFIQLVGLDPELANPLLINRLYIEMYRFNEPTLYFNPSDIVNLQYATVKADENKLPYLFLKEELAYVLSKRGKYIQPLQQQDHKVCLAIKGGGDGIGFSNLSDFQRETFIYRIKQVIDQYALDGVNLHDSEFGIEQKNNTNDAANGLGLFVQQLRKVLGDKIITYTQTEESPQGITDEQAEIKLGEWVDYAWTDQLNKIINPWDRPDKWWNKPIAGITKKKWGALNSSINTSKEDHFTLQNAIYEDGFMITEGINHVFIVDRVEYTTFPYESSSGWYMVWGSNSNLWEIYSESTGIYPPKYRKYDDPLVPKDY